MSPNVHETAAAHARDTRVAYADPVIHAHAHALLTGTGRIILAEPGAAGARPAGDSRELNIDAEG